ncbi:MAG: TrbI/VirB10 family protein [Geminicoccaceae bacterium]
MTASSETDGFELIDRLGTTTVAEALGISASAVRLWRKKGIPESRKQQLLDLAQAATANQQDQAADDSKTTDHEEQPIEPAFEATAKPDGPITKTAPFRNRLPPKPVRLNRMTVLIVGATLASALALGLGQGLRDVSGHTAPSEPRQEPTLLYQEQPDAIFPKFNYEDVTKPVPAEEVTVIVQKPEATDDRAAHVESRPSAPRSQEEDEAFRSPLFPASALALRQSDAPGRPQSTSNPLAALDQLGISLPSSEDLLPKAKPSPAEQRENFLGDQSDQASYLRNGLQEPISDYEIKAGTVIPAALITGLNSDLPGEIIGQVAENVYDTVSGQHLLIPQGTRIFGRYNAQIGSGQDQAQIVWDRLIMPNGDSIQLEAMVGTDKAGYAGVADQVDHHWGQLFGAVFLSSVISVGANLAVDNGSNNGLVADLGDAAAQQAATVGSQIVDHQLDVQPTITIRPGHRFNILVNRDMILPGHTAG